MNKAILVLMLIFLTSCEGKADNRIGYGVTVKNKISETCFNKTTSSFEDNSGYIVTIKYAATSGYIISYDIDINGEYTIDDIGKFYRKAETTRVSFQEKLKTLCQEQ